MTKRIGSPSNVTVRPTWWGHLWPVICKASLFLGTLEQQKELEMMFSFRYMGKFTWNRDMKPMGESEASFFGFPCWFLRMARWVKQNQLPNGSCCCPVCLLSRQTWWNIEILVVMNLPQKTTFFFIIMNFEIATFSSKLQVSAIRWLCSV